MSQVLVCMICQNIYKKEKIKANNDGVYICPNATVSCGGNLISVDENLSELILMFDNIGIETCSSCEGHPFDLSRPYITFANRDNGIYPLSIENLRDLCLEVNKSIDHLWTISEIEENRMVPSNSIYIEPKKYQTFIISLEFDIEDSDKVSISERLEMKYDFINSLYLLVAEIKEKLKKEKDID